jgi:hypothetical protein
LLLAKVSPCSKAHTRHNCARTVDSSVLIADSIDKAVF